MSTDMSTGMSAGIGAGMSTGMSAGMSAGMSTGMSAGISTDRHERRHEHRHERRHSTCSMCLDKALGLCAAVCRPAMAQHLRVPPINAQNLSDQGSILFTYVHGDAYCERQESDKDLTTSAAEKEAPLYKKIMGDSKRKQEVGVLACACASILRMCVDVCGCVGVDVGVGVWGGGCGCGGGPPMRV